MSRKNEVTSLEQLERLPVEELQYAELTAVTPLDERSYQYGFSAGDERRVPGVRIKTEKRRDFLEKGTEEEAQNALVTLSCQTRELTGGVFYIHPFHGGVWGTKIEPVAPGFLVDLAELDDELAMHIDLSDEGYDFDDNSTREAVEIGTTVVFPSPQAGRLLEYMKKPKANPNQANRDQAVANRLGDRWDSEFRRFNGSKPRFWNRQNQPAMELTPHNIVELMRKLGQSAALTEIAVSYLYTTEEQKALMSS